jgi:hypothetical protein
MALPIAMRVVKEGLSSMSADWGRCRHNPAAFRGEIGGNLRAADGAGRCGYFDTGIHAVFSPPRATQARSMLTNRAGGAGPHY